MGVVISVYVCFFNDTATTEIYTYRHTLSLHDALPICALIEGVEIAYREAGDPARPAVLLLHGFPTSSHMFRELIPALAERYHVLAPDYPGFGASAMPSVESFDYSFDNFARLMTALLDEKGIGAYAAYVMDYGRSAEHRVGKKV